MTAPTPGVPNWVDLATSDLEGAKRFYSALFGWDVEVSGDEYGGYTTFQLNGLSTAGAGPLFGAGQPTAWSTYFSTDDADRVAERVEAAGGKVLVPPFDVMEQGRMAAFLDQAGAPFSVWEAGTMAGAEVFDIPGSLTWNELTTRDVEGSKAFYGRVFGWTGSDTLMGETPYVRWESDGQLIAGMLPMGPGWPDDLPPHWMIYFSVSDCDRAASRAHSLGGSVITPPTSFPMGRYAVLEDPQGGVFSILQSSRV